jgi:hypothetical protein
VQKIAEGEAFAIGADFRVLDYSDGFLPDTDGVALELATIIREKQPDTIITHWKHSIHPITPILLDSVLRRGWLARLVGISPLDKGDLRDWYKGMLG